MSGAYEGRQIVGMDLHRRRSVLVRMTETGQHLETVRISNDPDYLREVMTRAGEAPEVVLEATYGWYWAADTLAELGAQVHLAHPLGVKMFALRRVKNDQRDAADLADLLRMGRLPEAWIAPPATRELRGWVRHRAKLVGLRSNLKCQVHAVLAAAGVTVPMSDLFGSTGRQLLAATRLSVESRSRVDSLQPADHRAGLRDRPLHPPGRRTAARRPRLPDDPDHSRGRAVLGAVFVAEIGDITRFARPQQLASWAGLTPKHHESDTTVHRGRITKQGSRLVRWAAVEAVQRVPGSYPVRATPGPGRATTRPQHRRRGRRPRSDHPGVLRPARSPHPLPTLRAPARHEHAPPTSRWTQIVAVMIPEPARRDRPFD